MHSWIALFRGINVGGNHLLPMAKLRNDLESMGLTNVRSYIQSGNVVFDSESGDASALGESISALVEHRHGFRPKLMIISRQDMEAAIASNPFPGAVAEPKTLHFYFLAEKATTPDMEAIELAAVPSEQYSLTDGVFYLHAPDGFGNSKLAAKAERLLCVATTARNYRTVEKLMSMVASSR